MQLDHIMFGVNDLYAGIKHVESLTGVRAEEGGSHPGSGTCNALLSLGREQYLEIIAPDPVQPLSGTFGEQLANLAQPMIRSWTAVCRDYAELLEHLTAFDYGHRIIEMSRTRPDGVRLAWQILFVTKHPYGRIMPFFINWLDSPHPTADKPADCELVSFKVVSPRAEEYRAFCQLAGLDVGVESGEIGFCAELKTPNGLLALV